MGYYLFDLCLSFNKYMWFFQEALEYPRLWATFLIAHSRITRGSSVWHDECMQVQDLFSYNHQRKHMWLHNII